MTDADELQVGELIENRYRILSTIGSGGMGTLYRVSDEARGGDTVALKTVRTHAARSSESVERFQREFRLLTQLRHPNLVSVYDYGVTAGGELYFTMEWIDGQDLDPERRSLGPAATIPVIVQICRALAYLHARGVVHGDLKPQNVLMVGDQAKIVDFGVALDIRSPEMRARYYTPGYSAPEMKELGAVDQRVDLYSLGALWYALLIGEPPLFMPGSERLVHFALIEALEAQEQIPAAVAEIIARLLAASPEERFARANEVIAAVNRVTNSEYPLETRETASSYALRVHFVDREQEIKAVRTLWQQACSDEGKLVLISGESGVGKTRLVEELEVQAELEGAHVVWGQCVEGGGAYRPWREVLRVLVRYVESEDEAAIRQAGAVLATLLPDLWGRAFMVGVEPPAELDAQAAQQRLHASVAQVLQAAARLRPTLVAIEDAHLADQATLDLLGFLARVLKTTGLLVCVTYRDDEVSAEHPLLTLTGEKVRRVEVKRLSQEFTADLARSMLGLEDLPALLTERLQQTTGGNAFFVQELIRSLAAEGEVLQRTVTGWQVDREALRETRLPDGIRQVVWRRLGQLSEETRQVLEWAAAMGITFWEGGVAEVGQVARAQVRAALDEGIQQELIVVRDESAFLGEREFLFAKPDIREASYESMPDKMQREIHSRIARWLMGRSEQEINDCLGLVAEHLEKAGQTEQAVAYLNLAGEQAAAQFANAEAVAYFSHALELTPEDNLATRYDLLLARVKVYYLQWVEEQARDLEILGRLAEGLGDDRRRIEVALLRARYHEVRGEFPTAVAALQAAVDLARGMGDAEHEAVGYVQWGRVLWGRGDYDAARARLGQAVSLAESVHLPQVMANSLRELGRVSIHQSDYAAALAYSERALRICGEINDRRGEGETLNNLGIIGWSEGDYASARTYFEQSGRVSREIGDRRGEGRSLHNVGLVSMSLGDYETARDCFLQDLSFSREFGERMAVSISLSNCSLISHHLGDYEAAREYGEQALQMTQETGDRAVQGFALTNLGHALVGLGRPDEAAEVYEQAVALRRELGEENMAVESLAGLARVSLAQGNPTLALNQVGEILTYLEDNTLDGTDEPFWIYLTCYHVLRGSQDPRAQAILVTARRQLQERAAKITDEELRHSFLTNVSAHREIMASAPEG